MPVRDFVAAVSVGILDGQVLLDLDYIEDSRAEVDMNIVRTGSGHYIEIQGTAETRPFTHDQMNQMSELASRGVERLVEELSLDGQFHHDPAVVGEIAAQTFAHDGRVAFDRGCRQSGFGSGNIHDLVLIEIFGRERHLPTQTTIRRDERLHKRRLFLVHRFGGEVVEVIGA